MSKREALGTDVQGGGAANARACPDWPRANSKPAVILTISPIFEPGRICKQWRGFTKKPERRRLGRSQNWKQGSWLEVTAALSDRDGSSLDLDMATEREGVGVVSYSEGRINRSQGVRQGPCLQ